jgi:microsomal epoxide hydrolase
MPAGVAFFPQDAARPIRRRPGKILPTLTHWTEFGRGGHFAVIEQLELYVNDMRTFVRTLR